MECSWGKSSTDETFRTRCVGRRWRASTQHAGHAPSVCHMIPYPGPNDKDKDIKGKVKNRRREVGPPGPMLERISGIAFFHRPPARSRSAREAAVAVGHRAKWSFSHALLKYDLRPRQLVSLEMNRPLEW